MEIKKQILDFTDKPVPDDDDAILIQEPGGLTLRTALAALHKSKIGFFQYGDLATATVPFAVPGDSVYRALPNDGEGNSTLDQAPTGMTLLWNVDTDQFDFSELAIGDMVDIAVNLEITSSSNNQQVALKMVLGIGGTETELPFDYINHKSAETFLILRYKGFFIKDANIRDNPAELRIASDGTADVKILGWYCKITRR